MDRNQGIVADTLFATPGLAAVDAWYGAFAYAFQIYFDFSGYSDMAIGLALMLGFTFPKNFNSPYRSNPGDLGWCGLAHLFPLHRHRWGHHPGAAGRNVSERLETD